jgi:hypothetical protein
VAVIWVPAGLIVNVASVPLNLTLLAPEKLVPLIVTVVPTGPEVGLNEVMVGAAWAQDEGISPTIMS